MGSRSTCRNNNCSDCLRPAVDQIPRETQPTLATSSSTQAETEETVVEQEVPGWLELGWAGGLLGLTVATVVGLGWYAYSTV